MSCLRTVASAATTTGNDTFLPFRQIKEQFHEDNGLEMLFYAAKGVRDIFGPSF